MENALARRPGTGAVSERHRFDEVALAGWMQANVDGFSGLLRVSQFSGGQSNPTFLLATGGAEFVLRKQPPGKLLPSAHAIDREYRVTGALADSGVPVPRLRGYCAEAALIGTPFYLMDYQPGRIFTDPLLPGLGPDERAAIYDAMNDALARLHGIDWSAAGLADFGRPEKFVVRQIARWSRQYEATRTDDVPAMEDLRRWLEAHSPADELAAIAHGDFRMGNLIFHPTEARVVAVLDWELATIGHPYSDLAYNCMTYHLPAGHAISAGFVGDGIDTDGIPDEAEYLAAYARRSGHDPRPNWRFFMAFSLFRVAAIQQGVYARSLQGNASSNIAQLFGESYRMVAEAGRRLTE